MKWGSWFIAFIYEAAFYENYLKLKTAMKKKVFNKRTNLSIDCKRHWLIIITNGNFK